MRKEVTTILAILAVLMLVIPASAQAISVTATAIASSIGNDGASVYGNVYIGTDSIDVYTYSYASGQDPVAWTDISATFGETSTLTTSTGAQAGEVSNPNLVDGGQAVITTDMSGSSLYLEVYTDAYNTAGDGDSASGTVYFDTSGSSVFMNALALAIDNDNVGADAYLYIDGYVDDTYVYIDIGAYTIDFAKVNATVRPSV